MSKGVGNIDPLWQQGVAIPRLHHLEEVQAVEIDGQTLVPYDGISSKFRLDRDGFHPGVTILSAYDIVEAWSIMCGKATRSARPTQTAFVTGLHGFNQGSYSYSKRMLEDWATDASEGDSRTQPQNPLEKLFFNTVWGSDLAVEIARDGFRTLQNLAAVSPTTWHLMKGYMTLWDFVRLRAQGNLKSPILIFIGPEYSKGDFVSNSEPRIIIDPTPGDGVGESRIIVRRTNSRGEWTYDRPVPKGTACGQPWRMTTIGSMSRLPAFLEFTQGRMEHIQVLHFQKTDILDRRMLAIILRSCPKVTMLGIYDCPMLHFGDVICFLDLISEINATRGDGPRIDAFDFYPRYHYGVPYKNRTAFTCGITWSMGDNEVVQRGFYRIILEAYLKASEMGIRHLFDEKHAFRDFLFRVPGLPLAVPSFLDGLVRYLELTRSQATDINLINQALYDMIKPLRMSVNDIRNDAQDFYPDMSKHQLMFCCSCGNEMLQDFFTEHTRRVARPHRRICAGCILRKILDEEEDHGKTKKSSGLDHFFPNWNRLQFNRDAPLNQHGRRIFRLMTTKTVRPEPPQFQISADGSTIQPPYNEPLVRDFKSHYDSVQDLPTLDEVLETVLAVKDWAMPNLVDLASDFQQFSVYYIRSDQPLEDRPLDVFDVLQGPPQPPPSGVSNFANQWDFDEARRVFCLWKIRRFC